MASDSDLDVLIVGAGPTGLALATQLRAFGVRFRIIDRSLDRARESRALAVQARTLELLDSIGLADALVSRGGTSTRLVLHFGARAAAAARLGDIGVTDSAQYLVRPDGYVAFRCAGRDIDAVERYLDEWL